MECDEHAMRCDGMRCDVCDDGMGWKAMRYHVLMLHCSCRPCSHRSDVGRLLRWLLPTMFIRTRMFRHHGIHHFVAVVG